MEIELIKASKNDARLIFDSWGYNHENFRYLSATLQNNVEGAQKYLERILVNEDDIAFHIRDSDSTQILGIIKAKVEGHRALVGFVVDKPFWGKGVATTAVLKFIPVLKQNKVITRIWATCAIDNPGSNKVLDKCGFHKEGILKKWIVYPAQGDFAHDNFSYYLESNN